MEKIDKETLKKWGFREDFDLETRFDLKTEVNNYVVSTVDLGIDYSFGIGEPLYYETMVFAKEDDEINFMDLYCKRYTTEEQARKGHKEIVELVKDGKLI